MGAWHLSAFSYGKTSTTTSFVYDSTGARVKKQVTSLQTPVTSIYLGKDYEVEGAVTTKHIFLGDRRITTKKSNGEIQYIHSDHINSSNVITDANGNASALLEYDPYGSTVIQTGTVNPKHKYTGQESDDSTRLYYYNARYYDPQLGRFVTADWTIQHPRDPQDFNRYAYARNNPIRYTDPTGLKWKWSWKGFFMLGVVGGLIGPEKAAIVASALLAFAVVTFVVAPAILSSIGIGTATACGATAFGEGGVLTGMTFTGVPAATGGGWAGLTALGQNLAVGLGIISGVGAQIVANQIVKSVDQKSNTARIHLSEDQNKFDNQDTNDSSSENKSNDKPKSRFVADDKGNVVDTEATPPGSYDQPDGSRTDILQKENHGHGFSHTHPLEVHRHPLDPAKVSMQKGKPRSATYEEVKNIEKGISKRSPPKGR